ncbi:ankyrin repeat domain-containing protein 50-like [Haliotis rubra]|uniref:ankyrin repeat domain-containing protein 50-like n=1 Tax=Haliotis rubra TaxID=36100 RepID=UPI001EE5F810|nr:ankyrin repeat domain-containing protein 50-like [Haliotis rubra]
MVEKLTPHLEKKTTFMREPLRGLQSQHEVFNDEVYRCPKTKEEWKEVAESFRSIWNYRKCLGAVDGKHFAMKKPPKAGSFYYNYKGFTSSCMLMLGQRVVLQMEKHGRTAAQRGYRDVLEFLVCTGSNVSQVDDDGHNVLHFACRGGQLDIVQYLVSQGSVDINSSNKHGRTPLMEAALRGHKDVFEFLVKMGANESHVDNDGDNILHLASSYGRMEMVKHILSHNLVDINAKGQGWEKRQP